jgi:hypothetical protein
MPGNRKSNNDDDLRADYLRPYAAPSKNEEASPSKNWTQPSLRMEPKLEVKLTQSLAGGGQ